MPYDFAPSSRGKRGKGPRGKRELHKHRSALGESAKRAEQAARLARAAANDNPVPMLSEQP